MEIKFNTDVFKSRVAVVSYILTGIVSINMTFQQLGWPKPMDIFYWLLRDPMIEQRNKELEERIVYLENYNKVASNMIKGLSDDKVHRYGCDVYYIIPKKDGIALDKPLEFLWREEPGIPYAMPYGAQVRPEEESVYLWGHDGQQHECGRNYKYERWKK